jgi:hypothetical protein
MPPSQPVKPGHDVAGAHGRADAGLLPARRQRELKLDPQDVFINLVEVVKENWSFGNGVAQYVT